MKKKLNVGDRFAVPLYDGREGWGQVAAAYSKGVYYLVLSGTELSESEDDQELVPQFLALTFDAKIYVGDWRKLKASPVPGDLLFPACKEGVSGGYDVVDHTGKRRRPARGQEVEVLPYRRIMPPILLEEALNAYYGLAPRDDYYNELLYSSIIPDNRFF